MKTHPEQCVLTVNDRLARFLSLQHLKAGNLKVAKAPLIFSWEAWISALWEEVGLTHPLPKVLSPIEALIWWERIIQESMEESKTPLFHVRLTAKRAIQAFNWTQEYQLKCDDQNFERNFLVSEMDGKADEFFSEASEGVKKSQEVSAYRKWHQKFLEKMADHGRNDFPVCVSSERLQILSEILDEPQFRGSVAKLLMKNLDADSSLPGLLPPLRGKAGMGGKPWLSQSSETNFAAEGECKIREGELNQSSIINLPSKITLKGFEFLTPLQTSFLECLKRRGVFIELEEVSSSNPSPKIYACSSIEDEFRHAISFAYREVSLNKSKKNFSGVAIVVPNLPDYYLFIKRIAKCYLGDLPYVISAGLPLNQTPWVKSAFEFLRAQSAYFSEALLSVQLHRFLMLLKSSEWTADKVLSSISHQVIQSFFNKIDMLAAESFLLGEVSPKEALDYLNQVLEVPFQEEDNPNAQIFILGLLEAAPIPFDALWLCGASSEALPTKPDPNPFIPYDVQRELELPRSSAERERHLAQKVFSRIQAGCPKFIVSYAKFEQGIRQSLTSLLIPEAENNSVSIEFLPPLPPEVMKSFGQLPLEFYREDQVRPVAEPEMKWLRGGASILANHAACPFKSFALGRLGLVPKELEIPYFSAKDRGILIHAVLAKFWSKIHSQIALKALGDAELQTILSDLIEEAFKDFGAQNFKKNLSKKLKKDFKKGAEIVLEKERLMQVVWSWLEFEKTRQPFEVRLLEKEITTTLAGLPLRLRLDRVDALLPENSIFLVDYKTGASSVQQWMGDRLESPQLPLYATLMPVDGLAFADLSGLGEGFKGVIREGLDLEIEGLISPDKIKNTSFQDFDEMIVIWKQSLEKLARAFLSGEVRVDPLETACRYCGLERLCRV